MNALRVIRLRAQASRCQDFVNHSRNRSVDALKPCSLNVQLLLSHSLDITSDIVIPSCSFSHSLWNLVIQRCYDEFELESYSFINQYAHDIGKMADGVAIYERKLNLKPRWFVFIKRRLVLKTVTWHRRTSVIRLCKSETSIDEMCYSQRCTSQTG